ncbi:hypothetical protein [Belnapia moabensis]|uniref:hypothetical protein n=1 Tax=Belnapia moabensis TaxID=365533 RepID=UPI0005B85830|nr:hypothetical protein [Belnapia moabensis]
MLLIVVLGAAGVALGGAGGLDLLLSVVGQPCIGPRATTYEADCIPVPPREFVDADAMHWG